MHRYPASAGGSSSGGPGGSGPPPARSSDPSFQNASNFTFTSRRAIPLQPYKLRCEREPLSARLGPPDFYPPTPNCAEEILNRDTTINGYKELIDGVEESKESVHTLTNNEALWARPNVNRYKESIRKRLRELNIATIRKRKAGQVYGVPLTGQLLAKAGVFPEHRTCGEDFRKKWVEDLSQRKRLRALAEHVPHGYQRRTIFEALIKHEVPLLRATWFIKIIYLNQVKPMSIGMSAGGPDKSQSKRVDLWTKNVLEYIQTLLDDLCQAGGASGSRSQVLPTRSALVEKEPDVLTKWRYVVRLAQWHYTEGLLNRTQVVDWTLKQLQDKESLEALELLLPIVLELIDGISSSQIHSRMLIELCLQWLRKLYSSGHVPSTGDSSQNNQVADTLVKLLQYLLLVVPDTFVALDCFPLPQPVSLGGSNSSAIESSSNDLGRVNSLDEDQSIFNAKGKRKTNFEVGVDESVDLIERRTASLARAVSPTLLRNNEGRIVQALDKALEKGDIAGAYRSVYDEEFCRSDNLPTDWRADVISRTTFNLSGPVNPSELYPVRFLCEWAVCDFRDSRGIVSKIVRKQCACRDMSRVYVAVSVLRMRLAEMDLKIGSHSSDPRLPEHFHCDFPMSRGGVPVQVRSRKSKKEHAVHARMGRSLKHNDSDFLALQAYSHNSVAIHDLVYAWLDQHDLWQGDSSDRLPLLLSELVREGLFSPEAYVRQLLCNGVLDKQSSATEIARASRHRHVLQHLPFPGELIVDGESNAGQSAAFRTYRIERRVALNVLGIPRHKHQTQETGVTGFLAQREDSRCSDLKPPLHDSRGRKRSQKRNLKIVELKQLIATSLRFPEDSLRILAKQLEPKAGAGSSGSKSFASNYTEIMDATPGCEQCSRAKRQKITEGKEWIASGSAIPSTEEEENWWFKKSPPKVVENPVKLEPPVKAAPKQTTRGRPKPVRKTQSLAQMASNRIDFNQGVSTTHMLEPKVSCPMHHPCLESGIAGDLRVLGEAMKRLRVLENQLLVSWLNIQVRSLLTNQGVTSPSSQSDRRLANGGISSIKSSDTSSWRLGEEQFSILVYIMDVGNDLRTLVQLLLWLLPISGTVSSLPASHVNHGIPAYVGIRGGSPCAVGETTLLSCLQRYENVMASMDMLPQALSAAMQRAANVMAAVPGGRAGCSALLCYVRDLLRKYGSLASVQAWEKCWKASCDQRLRAELEALKAGDGEGGFGLVSSMGDDRDDPIPPRLIGRLVRYGNVMKDIIQRNADAATQVIINKGREGGEDFMEDVFRHGHTLVVSVMNTVRQNSGGVSQNDAALVANAVSTIVNHAGQSVANVLENLGYNLSGEITATATSALQSGRRILQFYVYCLNLLKSAIDDRQIRMMEVAIANEANIIVQAGVGQFLGRSPRSQFHLSPEISDTNSTLANDSGGTLGRPTMAASAILALVAGLVVNGVTSLERMVSVLRVKDGLENLHLQKSGGLNANGKVSVMGGSAKAESVPEAHIHWFWVLIGDCRTILDGLVADLLGEPAVLGLARLQRSMALVTVFPPAYAIFAVALRRQQTIFANSMSREEAIIQAVTAAVNDIIAHEPFRDVCLRDTAALYRCMSLDPGEVKYAAMLDLQGFELYKKVSAMVPLRARLFLHALLDRKMPEDDMRGQNHTLNGPGQIEQVVQVLDELQAATFHWQWVELRLLLNEQVILEKLKIHPQSAQDAVQAAMQGPDRQQLDECEKTFTEVVLTRLLVRPDAAALYSEVVHLLGKALEDYLILHVKWVLENNDMLLGRKSLRQLLHNIAAKSFSIRPRQARTWDWQPPKQPHRDLAEMSEKKQASLQVGANSPEEGELEEEAMDWQKSDEKSFQQSSRAFSGSSCKPFATEKALADLVLPCLARSSLENRSGFAFELVKEMNNLEQHISNLTRSSGRPAASALPGSDGILGSKGSSVRRGPRIGMDVGSPGLGRRLTGSISEAVPVSLAALQTSVWLRLQFLLPLLPIILTEREQQSGPNKRQTLAPVLLRLLGTRAVQEEADVSCCWDPSSSNDFERNSQATSAAAAASACEPLFDRLLSILHALLSNTWPVWLKPRKISVKPLRDIPPFDKETAERMQVDLEHMQLPCGIRGRLQAAFPLLPPTPVTTVSAAPPQVPAAVFSLLQARGSNSTPASTMYPGSAQKSLYPAENNVGKLKAVALPDSEMEVDPWTLLEDGVGASNGPIGGGEVGNLKACAWLKGAVRIRRTDLTYIGAVDEES
ncbi:mediator of RNA polymerase II transcription subunit 12 isoform X2 [Physcomitrium patens]|uniref:Mediator complex subunit Med12 domain-containing protein n=1 Tax=Physcomitrium patens TaxID=3218 RepID=A0A2K1K7S1_PHYPA|nr:mediator of RNA polymerase II transcription subunit 12-like isoform X2 [Physcomitrium patens]PNR49816.1 hypothetical protein PHYPA_011712 [Physcomitrium patens]|eukprot:XP_024382046.1 mediator of RNA polymerase II transcription subunit 12-like isoform X2 [Physcomitrella patens]